MGIFTLKGWLTKNRVTLDNTEDMYLMLESAGNLTKEQLAQVILKEDPGIRKENLEHIMGLENRVICEYVSNGFSVDTGVVRIVAQPKGLIEGMVWNPKKNYIGVSVYPGKVLREALANTDVKILGEKGDAMFIADGEDVETRATNGSATAGSGYTLHGRQLKIEGTDPSVGLTLTNHATGLVTIIAPKKILVNEPSKIAFVLPDDLLDGDYTVTVTTQYGHSELLKEPRTAVKDITVGRTIGTLPVEPSLPGDGGGGIYIDPNA
ncbi:MAG: DUF4469 domain-containing protein [Tannerellaceae bacterium]|jgi:hypothetical protein|nr:DUF4469 domain-containing protein [Tannerellaceae bacterium]